MNPAEEAYEYITKLERLKTRTALVDKFKLNYRLEREFAIKYGMTIYRMVQSVILTRAKKLIESGYLFAETATMVGYKSELMLKQAYKRAYGYLPTHELKVKDIKWLTLEAPDGTHIIKQHAFVRARRKRQYTLECYPGNRMLCNAKSGACNEHEEYEDWENLEEEEINKPCKWCLEIYTSLKA